MENRQRRTEGEVIPILNKTHHHEDVWGVELRLHLVGAVLAPIVNESGCSPLPVWTH